MSIIGSIRSFLAPSAPATTFAVININSAVDYESLPQGFFNVVTASGKKSLGYNGGFLAWSVGAFVVDGGKRIAAPENRAELPTVVLNFQKTQNGVQHIGGCSVIDADSLEQEQTVVWDGQEQKAGVQWT